MPRQSAPQPPADAAEERSAGQQDRATSAGKKVAGEKLAGQKAAGQKVAGQKAAGQKAAGQKAAGQKAAGQKAAGKSAATRRAAGTRAAKTQQHRRPSWVLPLASYHLTGRFGQSGNKWAMFHHGLDFAAPTGTPIRAVGRGTIVASGWDGAYGNRIEIRHPDGTESLYGHMSRFARTTGRVQPGTVIGYVGATGNVTGPHVHLEIRPHAGGLDDAIDPFSWLTRHGLSP